MVWKTRLVLAAVALAIASAPIVVHAQNAADTPAEAEAIAQSAVGRGSQAYAAARGTAGGASIWDVDVRSPQGLHYVVRIAAVDGQVMLVRIVGQARTGQALQQNANSGASPSGIPPTTSIGVTAAAAASPPPGSAPAPQPASLDALARTALQALGQESGSSPRVQWIRVKDEGGTPVVMVKPEHHGVIRLDVGQAQTPGKDRGVRRYEQRGRGAQGDPRSTDQRSHASDEARSGGD